MSRITDIKVNDIYITANFHTNNEAEANMLRRSIMYEIPTYAIDIVVFFVNTSARHDEIIALRLGQLVIDNNKFKPTGDLKFKIDVTGPTTFDTTHIPDIPFTYITPIMELKANQRIICDVIVKKGTGYEHVKWRPVATIAYNSIIVDNNPAFQFRIKGIGMLSANTIFEKGLAAIQIANKREGTNLYFQPVKF